MQEIVFNDSNLTDNDIEQSVTRVKALLINSKGKILIVYNNYTYQLPGGHLKDSEDIDQRIIREVMFSNLRSFLEKAYEEKKIDKSILKEMLKVLDVYDNLYNTNEQKI